MEEAYIGVIVPWAVDFAPVNWVLCWGQDLNINQYQALYALIGTKYGQSTATTFKVPDLRGRVPVGVGASPVLGTYTLGTTMGANTLTLTAAQLPQHIHPATSQPTVTGGTSATVTMPINIPVNTEAYDATTAKNTPDNTCTLGQGKTSNNVVTNIYTTKAPTNGASLKPFSASGTVTVQPPTVQVATAVGANVTTNSMINNMQGSLCVNYIMCVNGLFPQRP